MTVMDLALVTNVFPPEVHGGYELLAADVARSLRARGHRVRVLTSGQPSRDDHPDTHRVLTLSRPFGSRARSDRARHLFAAMLNHRAVERFFASVPAIDGALVFSLRRLGLAPLRALHARAIPSVVTVNDDWPLSYVTHTQGRSLRARLARWIDAIPGAPHRWGSLSCERVLWLSEPLREAVRAGGAPLGHGALCSQGVDRSLFVERANLQPDRDRPTILSVGRLHPDKGCELVVESFAALVRRGVDARLRMAGAPYIPEYGALLRERARALGVEDRIEWLGAVPREKLPSLYQSAELFLFVSRNENEGLGLTWLEAMSCATPVVASPEGGARAFFDEHGGVERAERPEPESIADAMQRVLESEERWRALVARGREISAQHASLDRYVDALVEMVSRGAVPN
jgi:glycosyltransferase involved in cell wall biosynthesis